MYLFNVIHATDTMKSFDKIGNIISMADFFLKKIFYLVFDLEDNKIKKKPARACKSW